MALISQKEYARRRGVAFAAVQKAVASGRITLVDGKIDEEQADKDWEANTNPQANRGDDDESILAAGQYNKSRAVRESYNARMAKIEFEKVSGKLIDAEEVQRTAFNTYRQFRDAILTIPDRLAASLAADPSESSVRARLEKELRSALSEFADANG